MDREPIEEPAIHRAARLGNLKALTRLVAAGVDINSRADLSTDELYPQRQGLTPLMTAVRSLDGADASTIRWLLAHGADLRAVSKGDVTAAWYAAGKGGRLPGEPWTVLPDHIERLRALLDAGLDPDEVGTGPPRPEEAQELAGHSLLIEACEAGDPARVALLLERGVAPTPVVARRRGRTLAQFKADRLRELFHLHDLPVESLPARWRQELEAENDPDPVETLFPLFVAAASGSAECVGLLLAAGADTVRMDEDGQPETPLNCASTPAVVRTLLEAGVPADIGNPLFSLAVSGCAVCVSLLLAAGAKTTRPDGHRGGESAVRKAGNVEVAQVFLNAGVPFDGADVIALLSDGRYHYHFHPERFAIAELLLEHGTPQWREIRDMALAMTVEHRHYQDCNLVEWLLEHGARPTTRGPEGYAPIVAFCRQMRFPPNLEMERSLRLLAAASDPADFDAALYEAASIPTLTAVRTLLDLGASVNGVNWAGRTPLHAAVCPHAYGRMMCVALLLAHGADPLQPDADGMTPLDAAREEYVGRLQWLAEHDRRYPHQVRDAEQFVAECAAVVAALEAAAIQ